MFLPHKHPLHHNLMLQKKGRKDNPSLHQLSHQSLETQDKNCHVKEATNLQHNQHQRFEVYDALHNILFS
jgi:hypothetical protein